MTRTDDPGRDELLDRLAALDPVGPAGRGGAMGPGSVTGSTRDERDALAGALRDRRGSGSDVVPLRARGVGRFAGGVLVAASVAGVLAVASGAATALPGPVGRVAADVAVLTDPDRVDRAGEADAYGTWVTEMVACLQDEYGDAVEPVAGGYRFWSSRLEPDASGTTSWSDQLCVRSVGVAPAVAALTDAEVEAFRVEQVRVAACLGDAGWGEATAPGPGAFLRSWRDPLPATPPWSPYVVVPDADVQAAQDRCGLPRPAAPPAWTADRQPDLEVGGFDAVPGTYAAPVELVPDHTTHVRAVARCLTALGEPSSADASGALTTQNSDPGKDAVCANRYPIAPQDGPDQIPADEVLDAMYDWYQQEQVPCLQAQGVDTGELLGREEYVEQAATGRPWSPMSRITAEVAPDAQAAEDLLERCPLFPPEEVYQAD